MLLDNASAIVLNLQNRLQTVRFGVLSNQEFFRRATIDGTYLRWDKKAERSIDQIFQLAQK